MPIARSGITIPMPQLVMVGVPSPLPAHGAEPIGRWCGSIVDASAYSSHATFFWTRLRQLHCARRQALPITSTRSGITIPMPQLVMVGVPSPLPAHGAEPIGRWCGSIVDASAYSSHATFFWTRLRQLHCARRQALPITSSKKRRCRWAKKGARNWTIQQAEPAVLRVQLRARLDGEAAHQVASRIEELITVDRAVANFCPCFSNAGVLMRALLECLDVELVPWQ